jgi:hypothetical protein
MKPIHLTGPLILLAHLISASPDASSPTSRTNDTASIDLQKKPRWCHVVLNLQEVLPRIENAPNGWVHTIFYTGHGDIGGLA